MNISEVLIIVALVLAAARVFVADDRLIGASLASYFLSLLL